MNIGGAENRKRIEASKPEGGVLKELIHDGQFVALSDAELDFLQLQYQSDYPVQQKIMELSLAIKGRNETAVLVSELRDILAREGAKLIEDFLSLSYTERGYFLEAEERFRKYLLTHQQEHYELLLKIALLFKKHKILRARETLDELIGLIEGSVKLK